MSGISLHQAALGNDLAAVEAALSQGVNPNQPDHLGNTPLHLGAGRNHAQLCQFLLLHGADPNATNPEGLTPLHFAAIYDAGASAQTLLAHGADPNRPDLGGRSPIALARERRATRVLTLLAPAPPTPPAPAEVSTRLPSGGLPPATQRSETSPNPAADIPAKGGIPSFGLLQWFYIACGGLGVFFGLLGFLGGMMAKFKQIGIGFGFFALGVHLAIQYFKFRFRPSLLKWIPYYKELRFLFAFIPLAFGATSVGLGFQEILIEREFGQARQMWWNMCQSKAYANGVPPSTTLPAYTPYIFREQGGDGLHVAKAPIPGQQGFLVCEVRCNTSEECIVTAKTVAK